VALAALRLAHGTLLVFKPEPLERLYLGPEARRPVARLLARFTGVRDMASGIGGIGAVVTRQGDVEIVALAACCEAADALLALATPGVSTRIRIAAVTSVGAAALGALAGYGLAVERRDRRLVLTS
jgi:hypothetical protein